MEMLKLVFVFIWQTGVCLCLRSYECATQKLCADNISIDPRIQTANPNQNPQPAPVPVADCPNNSIRCSSVKCGITALSEAQPTPNDGQATVGAYPWQAYLYVLPNRYIGGGVLINQYFVLTAAHRVCNESFLNIRVKMGLHYVTDGPNVQESAVQYVYAPINYNRTYLKNDVALLFLAQPMNFTNYVNKICLPNAGIIYDNRDLSFQCIVTGFGQIDFTNTAAPTPYLKQVYVPITNNSYCRERLGTVLGGVTNVDKYLDNNEICAGGQNQRDACTQDGGSPLICPANVQANPKIYSLVGIVLWGKNCGMPNIFGVYLRVQSYLQNINAIVTCALSNPYFTSCGGGLWTQCCLC